MKISKADLSHKIFLFISISYTFLFFQISTSFAENRITVFYEKGKKLLNKEILGNNIIAYDPKTYESRPEEYFGYSDFGAGIWDPILNKPVDEVIQLAKEAGVRVLRFPGGCGTHHYDWKQAIGSKRVHFLFGVDEFLKASKEIGAEPVFTVSYFTGNENDAADLVHYLNSDISSGNPWAMKRAENGIKQPYKIRYFEFGNEDWHGDHKKVKRVSPEEYAQKYLRYYQAMKTADSSIKIGAILWSAEWNLKVMNIIKDKIDFAIVHYYPAPQFGANKLEKLTPDEIYRVSLAVPMIREENSIHDALKLLKEKTGREIPLAITEYNGGFFKEEPPYRHCLGTALVNAELLRILMRPELYILMANYWQFNNSYWGMIANSFVDNPKDLYRKYYKRPNYYVFELYHKHFGDILLDVKVKSQGYEINWDQPWYKDYIKRMKKGTLMKGNLLSQHWEINRVGGVLAQEKMGILEINFQAPETFNYYHAIKTAKVEPNTYYQVSGLIETKHLKDPQGVCLEIQDGRGWNEFTPAAESTDKVKGTRDWQYVEAIYKTLNDSSSVSVIARRIGEEGPLHGKAYIKGVKLEKFVPDLDRMGIPYLTVNASKNEEGSKIYLMVINKNIDRKMTAKIFLKDFVPSGKSGIWILNGPKIDSANENKHDSVNVMYKQLDIKDNPFEYTFEPHSLSAIEIEGGNRAKDSHSK